MSWSGKREEEPRVDPARPGIAPSPRPSRGPGLPGSCALALACTCISQGSRDLVKTEIGSRPLSASNHPTTFPHTGSKLGSVHTCRVLRLAPAPLPEWRHAPQPSAHRVHPRRPCRCSWTVPRSFLRRPHPGPRPAVPPARSTRPCTSPGRPHLVTWVCGKPCRAPPSSALPSSLLTQLGFCSRVMACPRSGSSGSSVFV